MSWLPIHFFSEDISFTLKHKILVRKWLKSTIESEGFKLKEMNFVFCSDHYLLTINQEYLKHDTLTDIITFDNSDKEFTIVADLFISIERVHENAHTFSVSEKDELLRVMVHGTLHLLGYTDKGKTAKKLMTARENYYLLKLAL